MRSKASCETCGTNTSFEKKGLYGDWECLLCYTTVPVLQNSVSSNRESYSNMEHPSLQAGHPDKKITSHTHYKEVCAQEGINPDTGEFKSDAHQAKSVNKAMINSKRKIHAPEK